MSKRTIAAIVAGALALGGGGAWFMLRSSGGSTPAVAAPVHHPVTPGKLPAPHTRAAALKVATRVFAVLPAKLPGWQVDGKPELAGSDSSDPVSRAVSRCLAGIGRTGIAVDSAGYFRRTAAPTYMAVSAMLGFVPSAARAASDIAVLRQPTAQHCIAKLMVGRTVSMGAGAALTFTSMKPLRVPGKAVSWEFDGRIDSNVIGGQSVRVVMLAKADRATEVFLTSTGLGAALPLATDLRLLTAVVVRAHALVA